MISLGLPPGPLRVACVGAHPDDIEIGCGGTLLTLAAGRKLSATCLVATGTAERQEEALKASTAFMPGSDVDVRFLGLRDGYLPAQWAEAKEAMARVAREAPVDIVFAPRRDDAHQDHRTMAELIPTVWRDAFVLNYEIPKWDGDLGTVTHYVALSDEAAHQKVEFLNTYFGSQFDRDWWEDETFLALMRLRGVECRSRYAEAFTAPKTCLSS